MSMTVAARIDYTYRYIYIPRAWFEKVRNGGLRLATFGGVSDRASANQYFLPGDTTRPKTFEILENFGKLSSPRNKLR